MGNNTKVSRRDIIGKLASISIAAGAFLKLRARAQAAPTPHATPTVDQKTAHYVSHPVARKQMLLVRPLRFAQFLSDREGHNLAQRPL